MQGSSRGFATHEKYRNIQQRREQYRFHNFDGFQKRGEHDIKNVMGFRNNPGFVFRDSRGFQAGGESEFDKVKAFIARRSKSIKLKDQHHAIW